MLILILWTNKITFIFFPEWYRNHSTKYSIYFSSFCSWLYYYELQYWNYSTISFSLLLMFWNPVWFHFSIPILPLSMNVFFKLSECRIEFRSFQLSEFIFLLYCCCCYVVVVMLLLLCCCCYAVVVMLLFCRSLFSRPTVCEQIRFAYYLSLIFLFFFFYFFKIVNFNFVDK